MVKECLSAYFISSPFIVEGTETSHYPKPAVHWDSSEMECSHEVTQDKSPTRVE